SRRTHRESAAAWQSPSPVHRTGVRRSRSWRGLYTVLATMKEITKHREYFGAVVDLADRQRRSGLMQLPIQRPQRRIRHREAAAPGLAHLDIGEELTDRQDHFGQQAAHGFRIRMSVVAVGGLSRINVPIGGT